MDKFNKGLGGILRLFLKAKDEKALGLMLDLFLTADEKANLSMRYLIVAELLKGNKTQREIAKELNVSIAKITRGSNELKRMNATFLKYLEERLQ